MKIINIEWLDLVNMECFVTIENNQKLLTFFSYGNTDLEEKINKGDFYCTMIDDIVVSKKHSCEIIPEKEGLIITGKLIDSNNGILDTEAFILRIDTDLLPGDVRSSDYISFRVKRIDLL
ncbi:MAG: hypothetical protein MJ179_06920 [Treponema sp.]|nr:hypothetical protein [Treponema sp.]